MACFAHSRQLKLTSLSGRRLPAHPVRLQDPQPLRGKGRPRVTRITGVLEGPPRGGGAGGRGAKRGRGRGGRTQASVEGPRQTTRAAATTTSAPSDDNNYVPTALNKPSASSKRKREVALEDTTARAGKLRTRCTVCRGAHKVDACTINT